MPTSVQTNVNPEFDRLLHGLLYSLLSWKQLAEFWPKIDAHASWYLYAVGETVPQTASSATEVSDFILRIDTLLHRDHKEDYCGIVYADNLDSPALIKIYDPNNLGVSCGSSKNPPLPGWIMSTIPPSELHPKGIIPANRRRWWQSFLSKEPA